MKKELLQKTIREIIEEKIDFKKIYEVCMAQYEKYKHHNIYITPLMDNIDINKIKCAVPISIKDIFLTKNILTTAASKMLSNFIAPYNATLVEKLEASNQFVNFGKTNLDEFAMGSSGVSSFYGPTINIWNHFNGSAFSPGGSSSGSAISVASGSVFASFGSDTGGSIRLPASWCSIVGFKPTYGVFSRYGIIPLAESFDHPGLFTRQVDDVRYLFEKLIGKDSKDLTSVNYIEKRSNKKKFAIIKEAYETNNTIQTNLNKVENLFLSLGYEKLIYSVDEIKIAISLYLILSRAECSSNLQRYDGIKFGYSAEGKNLEEQYIKTRSEGFGLEVQRRIMLGAYVTSSENINIYTDKAQRLRESLKNKILNILDEVDFILIPTSMGAITLEEAMNRELQDPVKMYKCDLFTVISNLCGLPTISVPMGFDENGSPVGVDIMGAPFMDLQIMDLAELVEQSSGLFNNLIDKITS